VVLSAIITSYWSFLHTGCNFEFIFIHLTRHADFALHTTNRRVGIFYSFVGRSWRCNLAYCFCWIFPARHETCIFLVKSMRCNTRLRQCSRGIRWHRMGNVELSLVVLPRRSL
jgi:hypothetical protein